MEKINIKLGILFGYEIILKDVPAERAPHVEKLARKHLERMAKALADQTFGGIRRDLEVVKALKS